MSYNFGNKPKQIPEGASIKAHNGVTAGNGHLTGVKEEVVAAAE